MASSLFSSTPIAVLEQMVNFAQARHNVLAGNIANQDTPGYRTRDLSLEEFQSRMKEAIQAQRRDPNSASISTLGQQQRDPLANVSKNLEDILYHDDSNVGVEQQVSEIAKNQLQHNLALTILNSQFRLLQAAISERT